MRVAAGTNDPAEVTAGLNNGEKVVIEGPETLAAGDKVREAPAQ